MDSNDILYSTYKGMNDKHNNNDKGDNCIWGSKCKEKCSNICSIHKDNLNI